MSDNMKVAIVIPTYNAGSDFKEVIDLINIQKNEIEEIRKVLVIDSSSSDETVKIASESKCQVEIISKNDFSHGGTRRSAAKKLYGQGYTHAIYMTQDVFLKPNSLKELISFINSDSQLGVVYGKQEVDLAKGTLYEYHARLFNYKSESYKFGKSDIENLGIKTIFSSDAFAIYNLNLFSKVNFFDNKNDVSEDMLAAHKFIMADYLVGYCSTAKVNHTHNYSIMDEFKRYKSIGRFYKNNKDIINLYGKTNSNGMKLVASEILFLVRENKVNMITGSIIRNVAKFLGHKVGYYL